MERNARRLECERVTMSDKVVLGILTAYHPSRWHRRQILRNQCLKDCPIPYRFVFGDQPYPGDRERCGIPDEEILHARLEAFDYAGHFPCKFKLGGTFSLPFRYMNYAHGGCGVWLSRKAMEMILAAGWDEHYLDSWPEKISVGFGLQYPRPPKFWDDHWIGEVLQGSLPYDDPLRDQPWEAYTRNGIAVYEDQM